MTAPEGAIQPLPTPDAGDARPEGLLTALLSLTSDAVLAFDGSGVIYLANDEALDLFALGGGAAGLVGTDVRVLFPPAAGSAPRAPFELASLPLAANGATTRLVRQGADGRSQALSVRCACIDAAQGHYLLVARRDGGTGADSHEYERVVGELSRANRRLSGTLDIVLGTLDSPDVGTLFERVLERLCQTMDASGSVVYLSERGGFHLRGTSASLAQAAVPRFLPANRSLVHQVAASEGALRLRVLPPAGQSLRRGRLVERTVVDEETRETFTVHVDQLLPFTSFMAVPVRFGGHVIALIAVGWRTARSVPRSDAELLDAVTRYLSVQLVGALSALRTQRRQQLAQRSANLRDRLVADPITSRTAAVVHDAVARDLGCVCAVFCKTAPEAGYATIGLPRAQAELLVPLDLLGSEDGVTALMPDAPLSVWLRDHDEPCLGALVDVDVDAHTSLSLRFLALRPVDAEPFDDLELEYLRQVTDTVRAIAVGEQDRTREHRIAQALQTGMRSQLQEVEGITACGIYSSATEAAFVGGDFYDLIRLPSRRACVIMGDVSGKGVEAASVSAAVRTALGAYSWEGLAPARMVALLNDFLLGFSRVETFATLFVGIVDLAAGTLTYCSAGHPPAILRHVQTGELEWLGVQSGAVGAFRDMRYRNGEVQVSEGDLLLLYTDGTTEARASDGRFFGEDNLRDAVLREAQRGFDGLLDRLLATVDAFTGNNLEDDLAMVALRFDEVC